MLEGVAEDASFDNPAGTLLDYSAGSATRPLP
jgi:hypothetical protein